MLFTAVHGRGLYVIACGLTLDVYKLLAIIILPMLTAFSAIIAAFLFSRITKYAAYVLLPRSLYLFFAMYVIILL
jgi:tryptophan-rich sensory protein